MAYMIKGINNQYTIIDHSPRNGLFYRIYEDNTRARGNIIYNNSVNEYCASLDINNHIHIACKNTRNQIIHLVEDDSRFIQEVLLDDNDNTYKLGNFRMISCNNKLHLFYTAQNPGDGTSDIIHHVINSSDHTPPQSIISTTTLSAPYECFEYNGSIYLVSIGKENEKFELQFTIFDSNKNEWEYAGTLTSTPHNITYTNMCIDQEGNLFIVFVQGQYGQYSVNYLSSIKNNYVVKTLYTCPYPIEPIIFLYKDTLWINWYENEQMKMCLSLDNGKYFTTPQLCTLQPNDIIKFRYINPFYKECNLYGITFYGTVQPFPQLTIINEIDTDNIGINSYSNNELKLYIQKLKEGMGLYGGDTETYNQLIEENKELKQIQVRITEQYNELTKLAKKLQQEGKRWRSKYKDIDLEYKTLKQQLKPLSPNNTDKLQTPLD